MRRRFLGGRWPVYLFLLAGLGVSLLPLGAASPGPSGSQLFPTGYSVEGRFLETWRGPFSYEESVLINGFPIGDKHAEVNPIDGKTYQVQWFERARFEEHPDQAPPNDVQLGRLGVNAAAGRLSELPFQKVPQPDVLGPDLAWFPETEHTIGGPFLAFWNEYGSWKQFGFPISEAFKEPIGAGGAPVLVQYFERSRFELQPGPDSVPQVVLGRLGAEQYVPPATATNTPMAVP